MPLSCEKGAHLSCWMHCCANSAMFKNTQQWNQKECEREETRNAIKLLCTLLLASLENKGRMYCLWVSEEWTIINSVTRILKKNLPIYFPEVGVLQPSQDRKNKLQHSRVMKFSVTKIQPIACKCCYSKDLLFNIQTVSVQKSYGQEKIQNFNLTLIIAL